MRKGRTWPGWLVAVLMATNPLQGQTPPQSPTLGGPERIGNWAPMAMERPPRTLPPDPAVGLHVRQVQVPAGFLARCGLADGSTTAGAAWTLTPREGTLFLALLEREADPESLHYEHQVFPDRYLNELALCQATQVTIGLDATKNGQKVVLPKLVDFTVGTRLEITPKIAKSGKTVELRLRGDHTRLIGATESKPVPPPGKTAEDAVPVVHPATQPLVALQEIAATVELADGGSAVLALRVGAASSTKEPQVETLLVLSAEIRKGSLAITTSQPRGKTATADGGTIPPADGTVDLKVLDVSRPGGSVIVNRETDYLIRVINHGTVPVNRVEIVATIPPQMEVLGAGGPPGVQAWRSRNVVTFEPLEVLAPNQEQRWSVKVRALAPNDVRFRVEVRSPSLHSAVTKEVDTQILPVQSGTASAAPTAAAPAQLPVSVDGPPRAHSQVEGGSMPEVSVTPQGAQVGLTVNVTGPSEGHIGQPETFRVLVTNLGSGPATNVVLKAEFDQGLTHQSGANPIETGVGSLKAGESCQIPLVLTPKQEGHLTLQVTAIADSGLKDSKVLYLRVPGTTLDASLLPSPSPSTPPPSGPGLLPPPQ